MTRRSFFIGRIIGVVLNLLLLFAAAHAQAGSEIYAAQTARPANGTEEIFSCKLLRNPSCSIDVSVTSADPALSANAYGAAYQWLDCTNFYAALPGETERNFTATRPGSYAVRITQNGCRDTSLCYAIVSTGIDERSVKFDPVIFPNPSNGKFSIDLGASYDEVEVTITNLAGQVVQKNIYGESQVLSLEIEGESGLYFLLVRTDDQQKAVLKMLKQ